MAQALQAIRNETLTFPTSELRESRPRLHVASSGGTEAARAVSGRQIPTPFKLNHSNSAHNWRHWQWPKSAIERADQALDHSPRRRRLRRNGKVLPGSAVSYSVLGKIVESDPAKKVVFMRWREMALQFLIQPGTSASISWAWQSTPMNACYIQRPLRPRALWCETSARRPPAAPYG